MRAIDPSATRIAYAQQHFPRVQFLQGSMQQLPDSWDAFDVVVSGLAVNVMPQPAVDVSEMVRVCRGGGTVAAYCWDFAAGFQLLRFFWDAVMAVDARAIALDTAKRYPLARPEPLQQLFEAAGLHSIEHTALTVPTVFQNFEDYWSPFFQGNGTTQRFAKALSEGKQQAVRDRLLQTLPIQPDGTIPLTAKAWAIRGTV